MAFMFDHQNPVAAGVAGRFHSKPLAQIKNRDDLSAKVDYSFHVFGRIRDCRDLRHSNDFVQGGNGDTVGLASDLEADDVMFPMHGGQLRVPAVAWRVAGLVSVRVATCSANRSRELSRSRDMRDICSAEAASSVEPDVVCCTSSRMRSIALTTAVAPDACSSTAELISWVISFRRVVARAICEDPCDCSFVAAPISCANL